MKKILALILAIIMVLAIAACTKQPEDTPAPDSDEADENPTANENPTDGAEGASYLGKTMNVVLSSEPPYLIVQNGNPASEIVFVSELLFDLLYEINEEGEQVPALATGYEWVDETHLRFFLRDDVYDVNGNQFTASDVLFSVGLNIGGGGQSSVAEWFDFDNWEIEDDFTFVAALNAPYRGIMDHMSAAAFYLFDEQSFEALGGMDAANVNPACGTGRYKFVEWIPGQHILLEYNENYWNKDYVPSFQYIQYTFVPDSAARAMSVMTGDVDIATELSYADTMGLQGKDGVAVHALDLKQAIGLMFNCSAAPFDDVRVRQAIQMLINPEDVATIVDGKPVETTIAPTRAEYWQGGAEYMGDRTPDIEGAKALLAEAGYADGFSFELTRDPSPIFTTVAEYIQAQLLLAGIDMSIAQIEYAEFSERLATSNYEGLLRGGGTQPMTSRELKLFDGRFEVRTSTKYHNPELDEIFDTFYYDADEATRIEAAGKIQKALIDDAVVIGLATRRCYTATSDKLTNLTLNTQGDPMLQYIKQAD